MTLVRPIYYDDMKKQAYATFYPTPSPRISLRRRFVVVMAAAGRIQILRGHLETRTATIQWHLHLQKGCPSWTSYRPLPTYSSYGRFRLH